MSSGIAFILSLVFTFTAVAAYAQTPGEIPRHDFFRVTLDPTFAKPVSGQGTVFTYTVNYHAFNPEIATPYVIALVELDEQSGLKVAANIVDCEPDSVTCGMRVEALPEPGPGGAARFAPVG